MGNYVIDDIEPTANMLGPIRKRTPDKKVSGNIAAFIEIQKESFFFTKIPDPQVSGPVPRYLKLNIGGIPYQLQGKTILKRKKSTLLHKFIRMTHEQRESVCEGYDEYRQEYFFERSWQLFDPIYRYYVTGTCHRPYGVCWNEFLDELSFWEFLPFEDCFAPCCWPNLKSDDDDLPPDPYHQNFDRVRHERFRRRVWNLLEEPQSSVFARIAALFSIVAVLVSNTGLILASMPQFQIHSDSGTKPHPTIEHVEYFCISWFTIEYMSKLAVAADRKLFLLKPMNMIDLAAIVPFYFELTLQMAGLGENQLGNFKSALLALRILRALRIMRIFKLGRYSTGVQLFATTMSRSLKQLTMLSMVVIVGIVFFSTMIYFVERDSPTTKFYSIPAGFWWCVQTMSSAGYGDLVPTTFLGKVVAMAAVLSGIMVLVLPISIVADNYMTLAVEEEAKTEPQAQPPSTNSTPPPSPKGFKKRKKRSAAALADGMLMRRFSECQTQHTAIAHKLAVGHND